ncbi:cleavage and polyadenylation specificity factor 73 [Tetranychus urticae]|uniref:Cleavage and polyadenylation specificity factor subunit 3 n=1 Tax=Tetranychus urticae TaxID=32264 RepID=T1KU27_TETUR|nr:cleavage and polyadenylation specificity factor 73 [Tetranychus urticae]
MKKSRSDRTEEVVVKEITTPDGENDILTIRPLGAGQEVGRSCVLLEFKDKKILLDCGIHPGLNGINALPYVDLIEAEQLDLLLISHFHLDHCGALPWFLTKKAFKGKCYMTHATKAIYRWLLADCIKVSNISNDQMLYNEADLEASMDKIDVINFHEEKEINGIRFWCYNAGHVLGAAMFMIEIAGVKVLYTGDYSRQEDRHLMSAEIPAVRPDVLIIESTYGTHIHENREQRENRFTSVVHDTVTRGGRCLIPAFALGRAQELLLILDEYWALHPELQSIPIYYASSLAKKCMAVYQTYIHAMNERIRRQIGINNPFVFKHISNLKSIDHFEDVGPCVVMATPGMLQSGLSRELFETWCSDSRNTCIIAGYCVEGTLAKQILSEPQEITTMNGQKIPRNCQIEYISFSAHPDFNQTSEFIRALRPPHIILVHGEATEMQRLKSALIRDYEDEPSPPAVHNPPNTVGVKLYFRGEKIAKVMGTIAKEQPHPGKQLSGILVKRNFNYHLFDPSDLHKYTDLNKSIVNQRLSLHFNGNFFELTTILSQFKWEIVESANNTKAIKLFDHIKLMHNGETNVITLDWVASPVHDMYCDALIALLVKHSTPKKSSDEVKNDDKKSGPNQNFLMDAIKEMFSLENMQPESSNGQERYAADDEVYSFMVDGSLTKVSLIRKEIISCENDKVRTMLNRLFGCPAAATIS